MCLICVEYEKSKLSLREAYRNFGEMRPSLTPEHALEVESMLDYEWELENQQEENDYQWWVNTPLGEENEL